MSSLLIFAAAAANSCRTRSNFATLLKRANVSGYQSNET
jgi:hypothetical protein